MHRVPKHILASRRARVRLEREIDRACRSGCDRKSLAGLLEWAASILRKSPGRKVP